MIERKEAPEAEEHASEKRRWFREARDVVKVFLIALAIVLPIRAYIAQPFVVRGASMEQSFQDRDYLVIDEISYAFRTPQRGEAIVFRYPRDPNQYFIKRIVGLPGETVEIRGGVVRISNEDYPDGFVLSEPYLSPGLNQTQPEMSLTLGQEEYFVLGDNRVASSDSRVWGPLPRRFIVGRALIRAWPVSRAGVVGDASVSY